MKYNVALSVPQIQQLKDTVQATNFEVVDSSWRVYARVCNKDKYGNDLNLKIGDICVYAPDFEESGASHVDYPNKLIVLDWMVKARGQIDSEPEREGMAQSLLTGDYQSFQTGQNVAPLNHYSTFANPSRFYGQTEDVLALKKHRIFITGVIKKVNGDFSLPQNIQFTTTMNHSFVLCEIDLLESIFVGGSVKIPDIREGYFHWYYDSSSGEQVEYLCYSEYYTYSCQIAGGGGATETITTGYEDDGDWLPCPVDGVRVGARDVSARLCKVIDTGRLTPSGHPILILSPIAMDANLSHLKMLTLNPEANDMFDAQFAYCGSASADTIHWSNDDTNNVNNAVQKYFFSEDRKGEFARYICLKSFDGGYSLYREFKYNVVWADCPDIGGGGGGVNIYVQDGWLYLENT